MLVTQRIPEAGLEALRREGDVVLCPHPEMPPAREELLDAVKGADALLCLLTDTVDAELMEAAPRLMVIANMAVGYNNIDVAAATARHIPVTNTPGVLTETTADLAFALLLDVARRVAEGDRYVRAGRFKVWQATLMLGSDVHGKTLGIVGMGRIGTAVARRARGFGMPILYHNRHRLDSALEAELGARCVPLDRLLRASDFVTLHAPYTPETHHLIGRRELGLMKTTAYLVSTARGPMVDEAALVDALRECRPAGAALDVYEREPELTPGLAELENVVLTPHIGSASRETRARMSVMAAENILAALRGERPPNLVNPEVYP
ncbi:MAG TPA: D-glycerate dehydrogenase [Dehalococcoidia bacterium]|nr:D-glycerate dehydrogenase [Dehalococcoidia bacterium]